MTRGESLEALWEWILELWGDDWGSNVDGDLLLDMAQSLGLLRAVPYDPAQHGEEGLGLGMQPGDVWIEPVEP